MAMTAAWLPSLFDDVDCGVAQTGRQMEWSRCSLGLPLRRHGNPRRTVASGCGQSQENIDLPSSSSLLFGRSSCGSSHCLHTVTMSIPRTKSHPMETFRGSRDSHRREQETRAEEVERHSPPLPSPPFPSSPFPSLPLPSLPDIQLTSPNTRMELLHDGGLYGTKDNTTKGLKTTILRCLPAHSILTCSHPADHNASLGFSHQKMSLGPSRRCCALNRLTCGRGPRLEWMFACSTPPPSEVAHFQHTMNDVRLLRVSEVTSESNCCGLHHIDHINMSAGVGLGWCWLAKSRFVALPGTFVLDHVLLHCVSGSWSCWACEVACCLRGCESTPPLQTLESQIQSRYRIVQQKNTYTQSTQCV